jgi:EAL domain-containing protein (putative c-di-GMP-specific phosphodiesterase class I)/HAMP domain-containing protein
MVLFLLALVSTLACWLAIIAEQDQHEIVITASAQLVAQQQGEAQRTVLESMAVAESQFHANLRLTYAAFVLIQGVIWLLGYFWLVQPLRQLAETVRRIETGDSAKVLLHSPRTDEIGELARAFGSIHETLVATRKRVDPEPPSRASQAIAAQRPSQVPAAPSPAPPPAVAPRPAKAGGTMVMPPVRDAMAEQAKLAELNRAKFDGSAVAPRVPPAPAPMTEREHKLEEDLRDAWGRGELGMVYQPIHSLSDGYMRGAESFLRWQHPEEGAISPKEFVPIAERSELIESLGRNALIQACSDAALWPSGGTPETTPFVAVNVSSRQLRGVLLFESVVEALQKSGLAPARLHLECPVAALRSDDPQVAANIEQLRGLGVEIWLDVVGADAADQSRWMKMSVSGIKIGRSPIAGKKDDAADRAATGALVATAHQFRVVSVVVGVEEMEQLDLLRAQGAELAQGYVLCKPVGTNEITRRLLT